ncbi:MAG: hypothetical protein NDI94_03500 [Candidatus Woesearchaeota archaeon]|nr:hypothetical protein [Candidatus Woesearchaeota archaeon]
MSAINASWFEGKTLIENLYATVRSGRFKAGGSLADGLMGLLGGSTFDESGKLFVSPVYHDEKTDDLVTFPGDPLLADPKSCIVAFSIAKKEYSTVDSSYVVQHLDAFPYFINQTNGKLMMNKSDIDFLESIGKENITCVTYGVLGEKDYGFRPGTQNLGMFVYYDSHVPTKMPQSTITEQMSVGGMFQYLNENQGQFGSIILPDGDFTGRRLGFHNHKPAAFEKIGYNMTKDDGHVIFSSEKIHFNPPTIPHMTYK